MTSPKTVRCAKTYCWMVDWVQGLLNRLCRMHVNNITKIQYRELQRCVKNIYPIFNTDAWFYLILKKLSWFWVWFFYMRFEGQLVIQRSRYLYWETSSIWGLFIEQIYRSSGSTFHDLENSMSLVLLVFNTNLRSVSDFMMKFTNSLLHWVGTGILNCHLHIYECYNSVSNVINIQSEQ